MSWSDEKILITDDEQQVAGITRTVLLADYAPNQIIVATDSNEAVNILQEHEVAVLLCDLQMPGLDGVAVLAEAHRYSPNTVSILVTARATKEMMIRALNDGYVWRCIEKPWDSDELRALVKEAHERYRESVEMEEEKQAKAPQSGMQTGKGKGLVLKRGDLQRRRKSSKRLGGVRIAVPRLRTTGRGPSASGRLGQQGTPRRKKIIRKKQSGGTANEKTKRDKIDNRYKNLSLVKEGGSGIVYRADDTLLDMPVAIKVLAEEVAKDKESLAELLSEARIAMSLSHKHIVRLHNIQETSGMYYLIMEYIDGCSFIDLLENRGSLDPDMVLQMTEIFEDALGYAHRRGVYHRDLKPGNIMLSNDGLLKIIDFGLACLAETAKKDSEIRGTPYYMSPEAMKGEISDQRTDIYSLSIMMHEFLTGFLPRHDGDEQPENILDYRPLPYAELPEPVRDVLIRGWAFDQQERWQEITDFTSALREALQKGYSLS